MPDLLHRGGSRGPGQQQHGRSGHDRAVARRPHFATTRYLASHSLHAAHRDRDGAALPVRRQTQMAGADARGAARNARGRGHPATTRTTDTRHACGGGYPRSRTHAHDATRAGGGRTTPPTQHRSTPGARQHHGGERARTGARHLSQRRARRRCGRHRSAVERRHQGIHDPAHVFRRRGGDVRPAHGPTPAARGHDSLRRSRGLRSLLRRRAAVRCRERGAHLRAHPGGGLRHGPVGHEFRRDNGTGAQQPATRLLQRADGIGCRSESPAHHAGRIRCHAFRRDESRDLPALGHRPLRRNPGDLRRSAAARGEHRRHDRQALAGRCRAPLRLPDREPGIRNTGTTDAAQLGTDRRGTRLGHQRNPGGAAQDTGSSPAPDRIERVHQGAASGNTATRSPISRCTRACDRRSPA